MAELRRCIGSAKFGIEAHEAPPEDFPTQPSQKDGLGRMCKPHWNEYTTALRKAALARKAEAGTAVEGDAQVPRPKARNAAEVEGPVTRYLKRNAQGRKTEGGTCSYTVGKRTCVAGATGHAGPHEWPKPVKAERKAAVQEELQAILA